MPTEPAMTHLAIPWDIAHYISGEFSNEGLSLYLIGGAVRDIISGCENNVEDLDFTTDGDIEQIENIMLKFADSDDVMRIRSDLPLVRTYIRHFCIDISTHHMFESAGNTSSEGVSIEEDIASRDLTINSVAVNLTDSSKVIDICGGVDDILTKTLRATSPSPHRSFLNDPVRILRAVRIAASLGYTIEPETMKAIQQTSHLLDEENDIGRSIAEIWKIMETSYTNTTCEILAATLAGDVMFGEGFSQHHHEISKRISLKSWSRWNLAKVSEIWWAGQTDYGVHGKWYDEAKDSMFFHFKPRVSKLAEEIRREKAEAANALQCLNLHIPH